ncbi:MAG: HTTM domain-containing protein [Pseudomonadota bacterium]
MTVDAAMRATEILLALALLQNSAEHMALHRDERLLFLPRIVLSLALLAGAHPNLMVWGLMLHALILLHRFQGPYNGGSDKMGLLILFCLSMAHLAPPGIWRELALAYLAVQVVLSYFISGQIKIMNPDWRSGRALSDVFRFSAYPVSEDMRALATRTNLVWLASWAVMLFEVTFPAAVLHPTTLIAALGIAVMFHLANAILFGLNRFVWIWIASYPSILWLQDRLIGTA